MRTSRFVAELDKAIQLGKLKEPFRPSDIRITCPGFANSTYNTFLPKHALKNPDNNKTYFEKVELGLYKRLPKM